MAQLNLTRVSSTEEGGTFGVLKWSGDPAPFAVTCEDPWRNNLRNVSCIPEGTYTCAPFDSPTHGATFKVLDVPNRTFILFHRGNTQVNTQGCILIGQSFGYVGGIPGILHSREGFNAFWSKASHMDEFQLVIR